MKDQIDISLSKDRDAYSVSYADLVRRVERLEKDVAELSSRTSGE